MSSHVVQPWRFVTSDGAFELADPQHTSYLYFPLVNEAGMMSCVTPGFHGDAKINQHAFVLPPVSVEDLHASRAARNFWIFVNQSNAWSVTGNSAAQFSSNEDKVKLEAGFLWQKVTRENKRLGVRAEVVSVVPAGTDQVELMKISVTNIGDKPLTITPTAAIPLYARSADNQRDHRHVTSLLHRTRCEKHGVVVKPTLSFDERGHHVNTLSYAVLGAESDGTAPVGFFPVVEDFIGEGGTLDWPQAITQAAIKPLAPGAVVDGYETLGGLRFRDITLAPGKSHSYVVILGVTGDDQASQLVKAYGNEERFDAALRQTESYWREKLSTLDFNTGDAQFNGWAKWVTVQPILRRLFGCSFLPYHDYGRGGRGWRDLWQDILALLLLETGAVDGLLFGNFAGVRLDGSNATIIGNKPGEFKADRNNIPRVWMDHGAWPLMTTLLYVDQSGDLDFLLRPQTYFKDGHIHRCREHDLNWGDASGTVQRTASGDVYQGTILEHLLVQHLTVFFHVGEHNNILLEGADWNDGMDMAGKRGESVAFTAFYAANLRQLSRLALDLQARGTKEVELAAELTPLFDTLGKKIDYKNFSAKRGLLEEYFKSVRHTVSGKRVKLSTADLAADLQAKSDSLVAHLRANEWVRNAEGHGWFNGYYDNDGKKLEGDHPNGARMTLTGQVFALMGGIATDEQARDIVRAADAYLYDPKVRGYRLNSRFNEVLLNVGRLFGFAFGHKENGAMFSHMAVMYGYALYERGFVHEGHKVLSGIYQQSADFNVSRMYPGIPEYFTDRGRGVYGYLTGSASWYLLTLVTRVFGVLGARGNLALRPKLVREQFDEAGNAGITTLFAGRMLEIVYQNSSRLDYGAYRIGQITLNGKAVTAQSSADASVIARSVIEALDSKATHRLVVELVANS